MTNRYIKVSWLITSLIPAPFLFHFYEYVKQAEAVYLLSACLVFIVVTGALSRTIKFRYILLLNTVTALLSVLMAMNFIDEGGGWFKPFTRDTVILLTAIPFFIGQLFVRLIAKHIIK